MTTDHCCSKHDSESMHLEQARRTILDAMRPLSVSSRRPLRDALGEVLAQDIAAPMDVPPHRNSAMDGIAARFEDLAGGPGVCLHLIGRSLAGHAFNGSIGTGQAVRIMTGAMVPEGADTVVMQEDCSFSAHQVTVNSQVRKGQHLRHPGDDIRCGQVVLSRGRVLRPADLGLLASLGLRQIDVIRKPRIAFFSTGDELTPVGKPLAPGQIHDSNRYTLYALIKEAGCEPIDLGVSRDDPESLEATLNHAAACADVIITTGGVSVGEADYVKDVLTRRGEVNLWKIAMKPGKPVTFGRIDDAVFFGLPGNPVSVMATFYQVVLPALRKLRGQSHVQTLRLRLPTLGQLRKAPGRVEFQRGVLRESGDGLAVESTGQQDSHILSSMSRADCFIVLPIDSTGADAGELVEVELLCS